MILFKNRQEAGEKLAEKLQDYKNHPEVLILGIPRGGVAVGATLAKKLNVKFDLIIPRKLPIPENPEMGFGAILSDGTILLNDEVVEAYNLSPRTIQIVSREVLKEVKRREKEYRQSNKFPAVKNKIVILVDDGLATGFTMLAAVKAVKNYQPKKIIVAVPVSPEDSILRVKPEVDDLVCLYIQKGYGSFAVASFYQDFHDLTDEEVRKYLSN
jgi:putative phosphoribosyl transferase